MIEQLTSWQNALQFLRLRLEEYVYHDDSPDPDELMPGGRDRVADAAERAIDAMDLAGIGPEIGEMWNGTPEKEVYGHAVELRDWLRSGAPHLLTPRETLLAAIQAAIESNGSSGDPVVESDEQGVFRLEGAYWTLVFNGTTTRIKDSKGMRHLAQLIRSPNVDFSSIALAAGAGGSGTTRNAAREDGLTTDPFAPFGAVLDREARQSYRNRLWELDDEEGIAHETSNSVRRSEIISERQAIVAELSRAVGLGGRDRPQGSDSDRARRAVQAAVRRAITHIQSQDEDLGRHFDNSIRTGHFCRYEPENTIPWTF